jgi:hypothetical protein
VSVTGNRLTGIEAILILLGLAGLITVTVKYTPRQEAQTTLVLEAPAKPVIQAGPMYWTEPNDPKTEYTDWDDDCRIDGWSEGSIRYSISDWNSASEQALIQRRGTDLHFQDERVPPRQKRLEEIRGCKPKPQQGSGRQ